MAPPPSNKQAVANTLLTEEELQDFKAVYPNILEYFQELSQKMVPEMQIHTDWMMKGLEYNLEGGKMIRGILIAATYKKFTEDFNPKRMKLAYELGWVAELFQAVCVIADDIMDGSETRRGKPCWYKTKCVGMIAINDLLLFENLAYTALRHFVGDDAQLFLELYDCIRENVVKTIFGQSLDCLTAIAPEDKIEMEEKGNEILKNYTKERYDAIVKYKTGYYTIYLPAAIGLILAGRSSDKKTMEKMEKILLEVGQYFQVQDDYLDCFGDPEKTGKIGTDIQDNKCTWLFVQAVERCNAEELRTLLENYGSSETSKIEKVKEIYRNLELPEVFEEFESDTHYKIERMIKHLPEDMGQALQTLFLSIYKRNK